MDKRPIRRFPERGDQIKTSAFLKLDIKEMGIVTELNDPVIGRLEYSPNGDMPHWIKEEYLDCIGAAITLNIQAGIAGPSEQQRQVYSTFKTKQKSMKLELQEALFEFYKGEREAYAAGWDDSDDYFRECLPMLGSSDQIWALLDPQGWNILGPDSSTCTFDKPEERCDMAIFWHGCWDIEHEFCALFKNGKLQNIAGPGNF